VALVTGAARRLGRALAERLAAEGFAVWVHYRASAAAAEEVRRGIEERGGTAWCVAGDIGTEAGLAGIVERVAEGSGRLDALVNNVGRYAVAPLLGYSRAELEHTLRVNWLGPLDLVRLALPLLERAGGASVVNLGYSGLDALRAAPDTLGYVTSKVALLLATRALAEELGPRGVRVNMVSPGQLENSVDLPADFGAHVPLGRAGRLVDVCDAVAFLVGERAAYVTGQNLEVAGGYMLRLRDHRA
jgi:NAD(P)-dependent dehydrogenase (short-subunit alcohol dehydrogenase family)